MEINKKEQIMETKEKTKNGKGYDPDYYREYYEKPLLVNTLCSSCHNIQHTKHFLGGINYGK